MNKTLKKFATAILAVGATVAATRVPAAEATDTQVLDNISVQLKVYSQGILGNDNKTLKANSTTLTTSDLIQQLDLVSGFTANARTSKLVLSTLYTNVLVGTPGSSTNATGVNVPVQPAGAIANDVYIIYNGGTGHGTNELPISSGYDGSAAHPAGTGTGFTNGYLITNGYVYAISYTGAGTAVATNITYTGTPSPSAIPADQDYPDQADAILLTNFNVFVFPQTAASLPNGEAPTTTTPVTNGAILSSTPGAGAVLGYWATITPVIVDSTQSGTAGVVVTDTGTTNIIVTQYAPATVSVLTNSTRQVCIMSKSGSTVSLFDVSDWIKFNTVAGASSPTIYNESGTGLSETDFDGINITAQTTYSINDMYVRIVYPTNGNPSLQTNLLFDAQGFAKGTTKILNLVTGGTTAEALKFQVLSSGTTDAAGAGSIGGSFLPDATAPGSPIYTNALGVTNVPAVTGSTVIGGATLASQPLYYFSSTFQTNFITTNTISATNAVIDGTITISFLSAEPAVVPAEP
jgi:hypothetical protein